MYAIGIDLGGTKLAAAIVSEKGNVIEKSGIPAPRTAGAIILSISKMVDEITKKTKIGKTQIKGVGLGVPGPIDFKKQEIVNLTHIQNVKNLKIAEEVTKKTGLQSIVDNDGNAAALGEKLFGAGKNTDHLIMLTIGTGIGSGIIDKGKLVRGFKGTGSEIGHMTIKYNGPKCACGNRGCIERFVSGPVIAAKARKTLTLSEASKISKTISAKNDITAETVVAGAKQGNDKCLQLLDEAATYMGIAISNILNILNPQVVIIGGGLGMAAFDLMAKTMLNEIRQRALSPNLDGFLLKKASLGTDAGVIGAASLFF